MQKSAGTPSQLQIHLTKPPFSLHCYNFSRCDFPCQHACNNRLHLWVEALGISRCSVQHDEVGLDLPIWSISHGEAALTVHCFSDSPTALSEVYKVCQRHGISHAIIQIQPSQEDCRTCTTSCMSRFESCRTSEGCESISKAEKL